MSHTLSPRALVAVVTALAMTAALGGCANKSDSQSPNLLGSDRANGSGGYSRDGYGSGAPGSSQDFKSAGRDLVYFSSDSSDLTPEAQQIVSEQARWLKQ